jgi:SAM-dependent methyltransferase
MRAPKMGLAGVSFAVSAVLLALEVAHVRMWSYATDPRLVYGAISIAFAGLGGGSIAVAVRPQLARGDVRGRVAILAAALGASIPWHAAAFARLSPAFSAGSWALLITRALPLAALCATPYVLGGAALAIAVAAAGRAIHRVYAWGLAGSALGCGLPVLAMRAIGLEALFGGLGAAAAAAGLALAWEARSRASSPSGKHARLARWLAAAAIALSLPLAWPAAAVRLMPFRPDPGDLLGIARRAYLATHPDAPAEIDPATREVAVWDPVSRVEVFRFPGDFGLLNGEAPIRLVTQDGGAGTILVAFGGHDDARRAWAERSVYATGYFLVPHPERVLIVGLGGGVDAVTALAHGARQVTGVEINAAILDVASRRYGEFQSRALAPVELVHADGRSYLESAQKRGRRWPLIQMSGADTYSAGNAGAFMFSESYLYTVEAFERYLSALEPGGVLALIRFGPEPLRAVVTARKALEKLGAREPARHFMVLHQGICAGIAIGREPLEARAVDRALAAVASTAKGSRVSLPMWRAMGFGIDEPIRVDYAPGRTPDSPYRAVLESDAAGLRAMLDVLPLDYSAAHDDRPFFFQFVKARDWPRLGERPESDFFATGLVGHARLCAGFLVLAALLSLLPLVVRRSGTGTGTGRRAALGYFACLGAGYMLVELVLMQRTVLLLGHPTPSVALTLAALLIGSGIGGWLAGKERVARVSRFAALAVVVAIVACDALLPLAVGALLPLHPLVRAIALGAMVVPLGVVMGIPFPTGLARARNTGPALLAWGLGINGFTGVLGSLAAVPLAMLGGFRAVMWLAAGVYLAAALAGRGWLDERA